MRLQFNDDGSVLVRTGKVEIGQGILTALTQIAAHELGIAPERVQVLAADTLHGPDEGVTSGSNSVHDAGAALRQACVDAREHTRGSLGATRAPDAGIVGRSLPRVDLPAKLAGRPSYIHDLNFDGLLHGRVLHPPRVDSRLLQADTAAVSSAPGLVGAFRDGQLLGVLCDSSAQADHAIGLLAGAACWQVATPWSDERDALARLQQLPAKTHVVGEHGQPRQGVVARTLTARYTKPWIAHASIGTSCALARWDDHSAPIRLHVWTHSQGIFNLRRDLALAFGIEPEAVRVQHVQGAGCYGHNGADDVAFDAAWLAHRVPGRPVRVLWSRADELTRSPLGPAMVVELQADLDEHGQVLHWRHQVWSTGHSQRPGRSATPALLGSWQTEHAFAQPPTINMPLSSGGGAERNAIPGYGLAAWQVVNHQVTGPLPRSSALRSLGALANVFAAESFVDEIAATSGEDPLAWRRRHLTHDPRALAVLELATHRAGWDGRKRAEGVGHGIAFARYKNTGAWCAVVAEVEAGAQLRVRRLTIAVDVGLAINPDGVRAQIEGGAIQATSWTLKEAVRFDSERITSDAWERYPILRFSEVPAVDVHVVPSDAPSVGAGEASLGPTAAAIANALFDALGVRVRDLPLTAERIVAAMG
ncbi:MAG: molybdopterin cofactor-binding domain-containing protein [Burkholderiales bacterium]